MTTRQQDNEKSALWAYNHQHSHYHGQYMDNKAEYNRTKVHAVVVQFKRSAATWNALDASKDSDATGGTTTTAAPPVSLFPSAPMTSASKAPSMASRDPNDSMDTPASSIQSGSVSQTPERKPSQDPKKTVSIAPNHRSSPPQPLSDASLRTKSSSPGSLITPPVLPTEIPHSTTPGLTFYVCAKELLANTKPVRVYDNGRALILCPCKIAAQCPRKNDCSEAHLRKMPALAAKDEKVSMRHPPQRLVDITDCGNDKIMVKGKHGVYTLDDDVEITAGLCFSAYLRKNRIASSAIPKICPNFLSPQGCPNRALCDYVHVHTDKSAGRPLTFASTSLLTDVFTDQSTKEEDKLFKEFLGKLEIRTMGELQQLSHEAVEGILAAAASDPHTLSCWQLLASRRSFPPSTTLEYVLKSFCQFDDDDVEKVTAIAPDVQSLVALKKGRLFSVDIPLRLLETCLQIRSRHEPKANPTYISLSRNEMSDVSFICKLADEVLAFRQHHAHPSWRKQDETRPVVTSLITYVNPATCSCKALSQREEDDEDGGGGSTAVTPHLGPLLHTASPMMSLSLGGSNVEKGEVTIATGYPTLSTTLGVPNANATDSSIPSTPQNKSSQPKKALQFELWCRCPRNYEMAVNYELSTPSGSRCSEQNCLGLLASKGLPTSCIREVFVHGYTASGSDTNPLFPCGVCENMLRRVSKDVVKKHRGDVRIFMYDSALNWKKLVTMPVSEISNRSGSKFKQFVEELRDDDE